MTLQSVKVTRTILTVVTAFLALSALANTASAQQPRVVISSVEIPDRLSAHERYLLKQVDWVTELRNQLQQSRSVILLSRDARSLEAILAEKRLADSDLSRGGSSEQFGLQVGDSILRPIVRKFDVWTNYQPVELLDNVDERTDSVSIEYTIRIVGADGVERFSKDVSTSFEYPAVEETLEEKRQGRFRDVGPLRPRSNAMVSELVAAIALRINPITIVDVQDTYFVIDRGRDSGISAGDRFQVYGSSRVVEHAVNNRKIRIPGARIGEAEITEAHDDIAFARMVVADSENPSIEAGFTLRTQGDVQ